MSACSPAAPAPTRQPRQPHPAAPAAASGTATSRQRHAQHGSGRRAPAARRAPRLAGHQRQPPPVARRPTPGPTGTAYPTAGRQPGDPTAITDAYPNYGDAGRLRGRHLERPAVHGQPEVADRARRPDRRLHVLQPGRRLPVQDRVLRVRDQRQRLAHRAHRGRRPDQPDERHRPVQVRPVAAGTEIDYSALRRLLGRARPSRRTPFCSGRRESAARLQELQAGTIDGMTLVGPTDFATVEGNSDLKLQPSGGLNTLYLGMNHDVAPWDNDEGPPGHRASASTDSASSTTSCRPARKSPTHFTPVRHPVRAARATTGRPRTSTTAKPDDHRRRR